MTTAQALAHRARLECQASRGLLDGSRKAMVRGRVLIRQSRRTLLAAQDRR